jgi:hypothetical protein
MRLSPRLAIRFFNPGQGPPMVYPVTHMAKLSQMPFKYEFRMSWMLRYYCYSTILLLPLWFWIQSKVRSPQAKAAWEAKKRSDKHKEHVAHMWKDIEGINANK